MCGRGKGGIFLSFGGFEEEKWNIKATRLKNKYHAFFAFFFFGFGELK